jgi:hypothetical protein
MQRQIIQETLFDGHKRAAVARHLGTSVYSYDSHLQAAFRSLRDLLKYDADAFTGVDRSLWYERIEEPREGYESARLRHASGKKGERSNFGGERSNFGGERSNFEGERSNFEGERSNAEGDRSKVGGDRSNSEGDRGKTSRAGAA